MDETWWTAAFFLVWFLTTCTVFIIVIIDDGDTVPMIILGQGCISPAAALVVAFISPSKIHLLGVGVAVHTFATSQLLLYLVGGTECLGMIIISTLLSISCMSASKKLSMLMGLTTVTSLIASQVLGDSVKSYKNIPETANTLLSVGAFVIAMLHAYSDPTLTSVDSFTKDMSSRESIRFGAENVRKPVSDTVLDKVRTVFDTPGGSPESEFTAKPEENIENLTKAEEFSEPESTGTHVLKPPAVCDVVGPKTKDLGVKDLGDSYGTLLSVSIPIQISCDLPPPLPLPLPLTLPPLSNAVANSGVPQLGFVLSPLSKSATSPMDVVKRSQSLPLMSKVFSPNNTISSTSSRKQDLLSSTSTTLCSRCSNPRTKYCSETGDSHTQFQSTPVKGRSRVRLQSTMGVNTTSGVRLIKKTMHWKRGDMIGQGGFGKVHIGLNVETGELMAVKNIEFRSADKNIAQKIRQLQNEIEIMRPLNHSHIVRYFFMEKVERGIGLGASINIFMEYVPGGSIQKLLSSIGPLGETTVVQYTYQILVGLAHLHSKGIIHRDIKGANILLTVEGLIKLADFGASVLVEKKGMKDLKNDVQGTPYWMAPEVLTEKGHNWEADIWSLGCTVLEMLTAQHPWHHLGLSQVQILNYIIDNDKKITIPDTITSTSAMFLKDCLTRDPSLRPTAQLLVEHHYFLEDADDITREVENRRKLSRDQGSVRSRQCSLASVFSGGGISPIDSPEEIPRKCKDFGIASMCSSTAPAQSIMSAASLMSPRGAFGAQIRSSPHLGCASPRHSRITSQSSLMSSDWPSVRSSMQTNGKIFQKQRMNLAEPEPTPTIEDVISCTAEYDPAAELNKWERVRTSFQREDSKLKFSLGLISEASTPLSVPRRSSPIHPGSFRKHTRKIHRDDSIMSGLSI